MTATHAKCGKTWTGRRAEHCGACCETFVGSGAGDRHRVGDYAISTGPNRRRCLDVEEMRAIGLDQDERGLWFDVASRESIRDRRAILTGRDGQMTADQGSGDTSGTLRAFAPADAALTDRPAEGGQA